MIAFCARNSYNIPVNGTIISGTAVIPSCLSSTAASIIARDCISVISGYKFPKRQPRNPNIGLDSTNPLTLSLISSKDIPITLAISSCPFSSCGTNSCRGGSNNRTVTGMSLIAVKMPLKSFFCNGRSFANALRRPSSSLARIISRMDNILSSSKNICSVLHKPIPVAPKLRAVIAS